MGNVPSIKKNFKKKARESATTSPSYRVAILGLHNAGKTTLVKRLKMGFGDGLSEGEVDQCRRTMYRNVLEGLPLLLSFLSEKDVQCEDRDVETTIRRFLGSTDLDDEALSIPSHIGLAIDHLCNEPSVSRAIEQNRHEIPVSPSVKWFINQILRITSTSYTMTEKDTLRVYEPTVGVPTTHLYSEKYILEVIEVEDSDEVRNSHISGFGPLILFVVALDEYDKKVDEKNRMHEAISLFEGIVNAERPKKTTVILLLNKFDLFKEKVEAGIPLSNCFPAYTSGTDVSKACKHIIQQFVSRNRNELTVFTHVMQLHNSSHALSLARMAA
ncbi:P-loop containing nucleoside triphosphate hydrolase protein [Pluteus cervinus]|uniref:P-loop containing nucleoside triphosphate hydrolase protein n=1 Tax=Pluteus cervinus TaxID=181527 RepID=A0ACD3A814_9AGAR|nr:P-loop containing nucleoside triphosphate hydrolase protein [Pluteus cervinus]